MAIGLLYFISKSVIGLPNVCYTIFGLHCRGFRISSLRFDATKRKEHGYDIVLKSVHEILALQTPM